MSGKFCFDILCSLHIKNFFCVLQFAVYPDLEHVTCFRFNIALCACNVTAQGQEVLYSDSKMRRGMNSMPMSIKFVRCVLSFVFHGQGDHDHSAPPTSTQNGGLFKLEFTIGQFSLFIILYFIHFLYWPSALGWLFVIWCLLYYSLQT